MLAAGYCLYGSRYAVSAEKFGNILCLMLNTTEQKCLQSSNAVALDWKVCACQVNKSLKDYIWLAIHHSDSIAASAVVL